MPTDRILFSLNDSAAICADDLQWMLLRANGNKNPKRESARWKPISFVRSTKAVLLRYIREKDIHPDANGLASLATLPQSFDEWERLNGSTAPVRRVLSRIEPVGAVYRPEMARTHHNLSNRILGL